MRDPGARVRVFTGHDRYADPWHPFAETSAALAEIIGDLPCVGAVEVVTDEPEALSELGGIDLLVVNSGAGTDPADPPPPAPDWTRAFAACHDWLDNGGRVLGVHTAANTFVDWPAWPGILGGQWIRGTSMHPPRSVARFRALAPDHPCLCGVEHTDGPGVDADDERYSFLAVDPASTGLLDHEHDGVRHVMAWAAADRRAAYVGLGHDARAYASPGTRRLVANCVEWLLG
ncbi:ThuA domain-containing protein [Mariniluteicoccus flavus]